MEAHKAVAEFHEKFQLDGSTRSQAETLFLRKKLIIEEFFELIGEFEKIEILLEQKDSIQLTDLAPLAKEIADLKYVLYGTEISLKIPGPAVFSAVHESNMSKLDDAGEPIYANNGKVLKGPNYRLPDIVRVFLTNS